ncbi:MAG: ABC-2 family transporter protein [Candidatus Wallbacteria bacterium]|nr:ABC-2 family transporter protein [Candidatus Wallbacteria bacterium]
MMRRVTERTWVTFTAYLASGLRMSRTYLADCLVGLLTYPFELALTYLMWRLFLTDGVGPLTQKEALAYYAVALLTGRVGPSRFVSFRLEQEITTGGLGIYLTRPTVPWAAIAGREMAPALVNLVALTPVAVAVTATTMGRAPDVGAFLALMSIAVVVQTLIRLIVGTSAFWAIHILGIVHSADFVMRFASGGVLPLEVFPGWLARALAATPFPLLVYGPVRAMTGQLGPGEAAGYAAGGVFWIAVLAAIFLTLWRRGVRQYVGFGV